MSATEVRRRRAERLEIRPNFRARRRVLIAGLGVFLAAVVWTTFQRQVLDRPFLLHEGELRYLRVVEIPARRGSILDRNGEPLAMSTPLATVWCDPKRLLERPDQAELIAELGTALGIPPRELARRLEERRQRSFLYLKRRVNPEQSAAVERIMERFGRQDLGLEPEYRRYYPSGEVFGHVIGFTNIEDRGIEGLELAYQDWLGAEPGRRRVIQDGQRRMVQEVERIQPPRHGRDLVLSLDRRLQFIAYRELKRAMDEHRAKAASAVVLDATTGEVLAMVNQPAYNPNGDLGGEQSTRRNRALTDVLEPGSTVKPFVVAAALERGLISPTTPIDTAGGQLVVGRNVVKDVHNYGRLDVTGVITKSSNVGVVRIAQRMGRDDLWGLYDRLGFGHPTGVTFPGEVTGTLRHHSRWSLFEHATHAFGYGLSVTAMQLARSYAVLADDGIRRPLSLLRLDRPPEGERVLSSATARMVREMMETVVSERGTARRAALEGYRAAGKTGTAKKAVGGGYSGRRYQAVFAGLAPMSHPRFVMVVVVDEPGAGDYYGGLVAAPVFARVMQGAMRLYNVAPDSPGTPLLLAGPVGQP